MVGPSSSAGLKLPDGHFLRLMGDLFQESRMPLFSFVSGIVFSAIVMTFAQWKGGIISKARRLLLPLLFVGTLHWLMKEVTGNGDQPWHTIFYLPLDHYWYLPATFLLMASLLTLTLILRGAHERAAMILLIIAVPAYILIPKWDPSYLSSFGALYIAPYFFSGHLLASWAADFIQGPRRNALAVAIWPVVFAVLLGVNLAMLLGLLPVPSGPVFRAFQIALGLATCFALMSLRPDWKPLAYIGGFSYAIFLFHIFFAAGFRIVAQKVAPGVDSTLLYPFGLAAGVIGPIVLSHIILKSNTASLLLLGLKKKSKPQQDIGAVSADPAPAS